MSGVNIKVIHTKMNLQLKAADLFKYVWYFSVQYKKYFLVFLIYNDINMSSLIHLIMKFKISLKEERIYCKRIFNNYLTEQNKACQQPC